MPDIDQIIKARKELEEFEERKKIAIAELDKILNSITLERRNFEKLKEEKEKFLLKRQEEVLSRISEMASKMKQAREELGKLEEDCLETMDTTTKAIKQATEGVLGIFQGAKDLLVSSDLLKERFEGVLKVFETARQGLEKRIIDNSEFEKQLKNEKSKVEKREKIADQKLKQAKEIAYWHKEPGTKYKVE